MVGSTTAGAANAHQNVWVNFFETIDAPHIRNELGYVGPQDSQIAQDRQKWRGMLLNKKPKPTHKILFGHPEIGNVYKVFVEALQKEHIDVRSLTKWLTAHLDDLFTSDNVGLINSFYRAEALRILIISVIKDGRIKSEVNVKKGLQKRYLEKLAVSLCKAPIADIQRIQKQIVDLINDLKDLTKSKEIGNYECLNGLIKSWLDDKVGKQSNQVRDFLNDLFEGKINTSGLLPLSSDAYNNKDKLLTELSLYLAKAVPKYKYPILEHLDSAINKVVNIDGESEQNKFLAQAANPLHVFTIKQELVDQKNRELVYNAQVDQHVSYPGTSNSQLFEEKFFNKKFEKIARFYDLISKPQDGTDFGKFYTNQKFKASAKWVVTFRGLQDYILQNYQTFKKDGLRLVEDFDVLKNEFCKFIEDIDALPAEAQILCWNLLPLEEIKLPSDLNDLVQVGYFLKNTKETLTEASKALEIFKNAVENPGVGASSASLSPLNPDRLRDFITRQRQYLALVEVEGQPNQTVRKQNVENLLTLMVSTFKLEPLSATSIHNAIFTEEGKIFYDKGEQDSSKALKYAAAIYAAIAHPFSEKAAPAAKDHAKRSVQQPGEKALADAIPRAPSNEFIKAYFKAKLAAQAFLASLRAADTTSGAVPSTPTAAPPADLAADGVSATPAAPPAPDLAADGASGTPAAPPAPDLAADRVSATPAAPPADQTPPITPGDLQNGFEQLFTNANAFKALEKIASEEKVAKNRNKRFLQALAKGGSIDHVLTGVDSRLLGVLNTVKEMQRDLDEHEAYINKFNKVKEQVKALKFDVDQSIDKLAKLSWLGNPLNGVVRIKDDLAEDVELTKLRDYFSSLASEFTRLLTSTETLSFSDGQERLLRTESNKLTAFYRESSKLIDNLGSPPFTEVKKRDLKEKVDSITNLIFSFYPVIKQCGIAQEKAVLAALLSEAPKDSEEESGGSVPPDASRAGDSSTAADADPRPQPPPVRSRDGARAASQSGSDDGASADDPLNKAAAGGSPPPPPPGSTTASANPPPVGTPPVAAPSQAGPGSKGPPGDGSDAATGAKPGSSVDARIADMEEQLRNWRTESWKAKWTEKAWLKKPLNDRQNGQGKGDKVPSLSAKDLIAEGVKYELLTPDLDKCPSKDLLKEAFDNYFNSRGKDGIDKEEYLRENQVMIVEYNNNKFIIIPDVGVSEVHVDGTVKKLKHRDAYLMYDFNAGNGSYLFEHLDLEKIYGKQADPPIKLKCAILDVEKSQDDASKLVTSYKFKSASGAVEKRVSNPFGWVAKPKLSNTMFRARPMFIFAPTPAGGAATSSAAGSDSASQQ